jgi:hypothetical protein
VETQKSRRGFPSIRADGIIASRELSRLIRLELGRDGVASPYIHSSQLPFLVRSAFCLIKLSALVGEKAAWLSISIRGLIGEI